jgi:ubiquitin C-terminal hydrolase
MNFPFKKIIINCTKRLKLLTYTEGYKEGFRNKLIELEETSLTLDDCLRNFTQKEKLSKENSWFCGKCKDFKDAVKQMEIYKSNKIMVLAFKRFTRSKKIRTTVKYPI